MKSSWPKSPEIKTTLHLGLKNHNIFHCTPRRLSFTEKNGLKKIIEDLLERRIVTPSNAEYSSPIVLVKKKNGEIRMCVDFRTLNKCLESDNYPLPLIEDQIDFLKGNSILCA